MSNARSRNQLGLNPGASSPARLAGLVR